MQRRFLQLAWLLLAVGLVRSEVLAQGAYSVVPDQVYATVTDALGQPLDLALDLYLPDAQRGPRPVVVWIHGGSWISGDKANPPAEPLAGAGYAVASINYRLLADAIWPAQLHDCKAAIRWLRAHAALFDLDPDRIGVWGGSAGGHLAHMLNVTGDATTGRVGGESIDLEGSVGAYLGESSRVQASAAFYPPTELLRISQFPNVVDVDAPGSPESQLVGAALQTVPARAKSAGPLAFLGREDAPMFFAHGSIDVVVPMDQSAHVAQVARDSFGLDVALEVVRDAGHGVIGFPPDASYAFFDRVLKNLGDPTVSITANANLLEGGGGTGSFIVTRSGSVALPLDVHLAYGGSAGVGTDVAALPHRVTIAPGSPSALVTPTVLDDALVEGTETLRAFVRHSVEYRIDANATQAELELLDDESPAALPTITLAVPDDTATENGDNGLVRLSRSGSLASVLAVDLRVSGDALRGRDFQEPGSTVVFPVGAATADVSVVPVDDDIAEPSELIVFEVLPGANYAVGAARVGHVALYDDDRTSGVPILNFGVSDPVADEAGESGRITVYATDVSGVATPMSVALAGSALPGIDFAMPGPLEMPAFGLVTNAEFTPLPDGLVEGDEEVVATLQAAPGFQLGIVDQARLRIRDANAPILGPAPIAFEMTSMSIGTMAVASLSKGPPLAPYVIYMSQERAFIPLPILAYPVLIAPIDLIVLSSGSLDFFGSRDLAVPVPYDPTLLERRYHFQALVLASPILLSERVERIPTAPL
ncbi:MAG: alpha/beta hydrolase [Planctomycetota bacterium]